MDLNTAHRDTLIRILRNVLNDAEDIVAGYWCNKSVHGRPQKDFYSAICDLKNSLDELKRTHIE